MKLIPSPEVRPQNHAGNIRHLSNHILHHRPGIDLRAVVDEQREITGEERAQIGVADCVRVEGAGLYGLREDGGEVDGWVEWGLWLGEDDGGWEEVWDWGRVREREEMRVERDMLVVRSARVKRGRRGSTLMGVGWEGLLWCLDWWWESKTPLRCDGGVYGRRIVERVSER